MPPASNSNILEELTQEERELARCCLIAAARGPFFGDFEFQSLFGISRDTVETAARSLEQGDFSDVILFRAISGALNNLLRYPHREDDALAAWVPGGREAIQGLDIRLGRLRAPLRCVEWSASMPIQLNGRIYRTVRFTLENSGTGIASQTWHDGHWHATVSGPGATAIEHASPATGDELSKLGVNCSELGQLF